MRHNVFRLLAVTLACCLAAGTIWAQRQGQPGRRPPGAQEPGGGQQQKPPPNLPDDPKLLDLHKDFVVKVAKLAKDYERNNQTDKARVCYEQILKLLPGHPEAEAMLAKIRETEATAERRVFDVQANKGWQDTGVHLIAGKPVRIQADGSWLFRMSHQLGPDGMSIPKELRDFNLGSLIGLVAVGDPKDARPFFIGSEIEFTADTSGPLLLRMYDSDPADNSGKLNVEIRGTFERE